MLLLLLQAMAMLLSVPSHVGDVAAAAAAAADAADAAGVATMLAAPAPQLGLDLNLKLKLALAETETDEFEPAFPGLQAGLSTPQTVEPTATATDRQHCPASFVPESKDGTAHVFKSVNAKRGCCVLDKQVPNRNDATTVDNDLCSLPPP